MNTETTTSFFSAVIRHARTSRGLSQAELAERCGNFQPAVAAWEAGRTVTEGTLAKVARALKVPIEVLLYPLVREGYARHRKRRKKRRPRHATRSS